MISIPNCLIASRIQLLILSIYPFHYLPRFDQHVNQLLWMSTGFHRLVRYTSIFISFDFLPTGLPTSRQCVLQRTYLTFIQQFCIFFCSPCKIHSWLVMGCQCQRILSFDPFSASQAGWFPYSAFRFFAWPPHSTGSPLLSAAHCPLATGLTAQSFTWIAAWQLLSSHVAHNAATQSINEANIINENVIYRIRALYSLYTDLLFYKDLKYFCVWFY